ncbi:flagellar brake protein [Alicyclobacillus macrosporangiidus]|uniref:C-di-GMP-binding flagellar brake protein YcgR, contains PilZNR and PilZ domains n=1 Tax=Alicyclobacillus macrosporangiidus TaxID=392015 RepID=A0A1I7L6Y6_9BACL|nr:PilZ domain-containing protein [Alicyclobacillus macrosporangiidus]SFV05562.1 c-di-GMP-binding flagellar brake protein YcgR, contains PilZNR and PilZ domains [Alicyclobacillus macrosporangiidus]
MSLPAIGQVLRVRTRPETQDYYQSRLVETGERDLFIDIPLHADHHTPLDPAEQEVWVEYHGRDGALRRFRTQVLGMAFLPSPAWRIVRPKPDEIAREQRREFVRVDTDIDVKLTVPLESGVQHITVRGHDISGGGLSVWLPRTVVLHPGVTVEAQFVLPYPEYPVHARCTVIRVGDRNERGLALASMKFEDLKESVRQRIIQYTFWRQLRSR